MMRWWRVILAIIVLIIVLSILIWIGYKLDWTGFGEYTGPANQTNQTYQRAKTLWDWMELLIVPAILASGATGGAYLLNESARKRERAAEIAENYADDKRREDALQTYLDKITELLLKENLREPEEKSDVRAVARVRTLTVLRGLDGDRKGALLQFLYEANLIYKDKKIINLSGADLSNAYLRGANLYKANLSGADLSNAELRKAELREAIYTKETKDIIGTKWPDRFDPDERGAKCINEKESS